MELDWSLLFYIWIAWMFFGSTIKELFSSIGSGDSEAKREAKRANARLEEIEKMLGDKGMSDAIDEIMESQKTPPPARKPKKKESKHDTILRHHRDRTDRITKQAKERAEQLTNKSKEGRERLIKKAKGNTERLKKQAEKRVKDIRARAENLLKKEKVEQQTRKDNEAKLDIRNSLSLD